MYSACKVAVARFIKTAVVLSCLDDETVIAKAIKLIIKTAVVVCCLDNETVIAKAVKLILIY